LKASGIIESASMVRIAPAANPWTNARTPADAESENANPIPAANALTSTTDPHIAKIGYGVHAVLHEPFVAEMASGQVREEHGDEQRDAQSLAGKERESKNDGLRNAVEHRSEEDRLREEEARFGSADFRSAPPALSIKRSPIKNLSAPMSRPIQMPFPPAEANASATRS
jgi:hypothetical protein